MSGRPLCAVYVLALALATAGLALPARADEPPPPPTAPAAPEAPLAGDVPVPPAPEPPPRPPWRPATIPSAPAPARYPCAPPASAIPCYPARVVPGPVPRRRPCFELVLEGSISRLDDLEGPFGRDGPDPMNWGGLDYGPLWGGGVQIAIALTPRSRLHFRGAYLGQIDAASRSAGGFAFAPPIAGIATTNTGSLRAEAEAMTGELSWLCELCSSRCVRFDAGLGFRASSFKEQGLASEFAAAFDPAFAGTPFVEAKTTNTFLGGQVVTAAHWDVSPCFEVYAAFKPALGMMARKVGVRDRAIFSGGEHGATTKRDELAFDFEAELSVRWDIGSCLFLTGGYRLLFLDEVVRAHDAMDFSRALSGAVQPRHATDGAFLHSLFVGVGVRL